MRLPSLIGAFDINAKYASWQLIFRFRNAVLLIAKQQGYSHMKFVNCLLKLYLHT